jgi:uncharacterized protein (TIGR00369 family)
VSDTEILSFPQCFVCGSENPMGLHVEFVPDSEQGCRAEYTVRVEDSGWPNVMHGGLLFTLMDEALAWALCYAGLRGVTARGDVRFHQPVSPGSRLLVTGRIVERNRRLITARAEIRQRERTPDLVAELNGTMFVSDVEK